MRMTSFHPDVRQILLTVGMKYGPLTGDVFFVVKGGTAAEDWFTRKVPQGQIKTTIPQALDECTADQGNTILVAPGYTANIATADAIDFDVNGVKCIGLGHGEIRPTFTWTAGAGNIGVSADSVLVANMTFNASVDSCLKGFDVEDGSTDFIIEDCRFGVDADGTDEFDRSITFGDQCNHSIVRRCTFHQGTGNAVAAIWFEHDSDYMTVEYCFTSGDYSTAVINGSEQCDMILIQHNTLYNGQAAGIGLNTEPCIELAATTTGVIQYNLCCCNLATKAASIVAADCHLHENYYNEDESGSATSGIIGTASADD